VRADENTISFEVRGLPIAQGSSRAWVVAGKPIITSTAKGLSSWRRLVLMRAVVEGRSPGPIGRFVTAPRADDPAKVSFCFSGDSRESYKPFTIMDAVRAQRPDFFLHLGDTIYADRGGTARRLEEFWAKYRANRDDAATQRCFQETSFYVVWDDHEVEDNFTPDHPLAPVGRRAAASRQSGRARRAGPLSRRSWSARARA